MIQTVSRADFHEDFARMRPDNFTAAGLDALYDYFDQYEADSGEAVEFDVIALCCEYTEYASLEAAFDEGVCTSFEELTDETTVLEIPGTDGFIIQDF